jgi:hypothetical protein
MIAQVCFLYAELTALFAAAAAVMFQLMGPGAAWSGRNEYCS